MNPEVTSGDHMIDIKGSYKAGGEYAQDSAQILQKTQSKYKRT